MKTRIIIAIALPIILASSLSGASCAMERLNARLLTTDRSNLLCETKPDGNEECKLTPFPAPIAKFAGACERLREKPKDKALQKEFFLHFPSNYYMLRTYFGYEVNAVLGELQKAPLFYGGDMRDAACVELFFRLDTIQKECLYEKIINIAQDGDPQEGGGTQDFTSFVDSYIMEQKELRDFIGVLSKRSRKEQGDFWYYFFNSFEMSLIPNYLQEIKKFDINAHKIMLEEYLKYRNGNNWSG
jgi:hypothetical protein